ncbi:ABC transporter substrate-binding protein/permease [Bombilactobacillus thymidiniphilus]|uniref:ABC transporter substrate-binding protein/permease n=1 Tax=Bombilactobacillus thymidiniphilus TaxID=2923363 RepID=A0ABY4PCM2_9LACO|nr:ABC transporter substrate-binding protein/permease [Bombilactobacillus thymidiniphilus]UQS83503.1 ABC transporter substrate-binding protein/permease [Bombilactobacillus thymidiniphilus]
MNKQKYWLPVLGIFVALIGCITINTPIKAADTIHENYVQKIKAKKELVMGTSPDFPPYEFVKNIHGKSTVVGLDVEVGQEIASDLGVKLVVERMDFDSLLVALETGKVDMVISGMNNTPQRAKSVSFSKNYYQSGQDLLIRQADIHRYHNYRSLSNRTIGAQTGSIQYSLVKQQAKKAKLKGMDKDNDLILALQTHKIDALAVDTATAKAFIQNTNGLIRIPSGFKTSSAGSAVAFPKGANSLVQVANQSITKIRKNDLINKVYLPKVSKYMTNHKSKKDRQKANSMWAYKDFFLAGIGYTLMISALSVCLGLLLGIFLSLMRLSKNSWAKKIAGAYIEFVRGTPLMVQLLFIYFGLGIVVNIPALLSGIIAVSLNSAAYVAEVIRSGINSINVGQKEAARSLGMSRQLTMRYVIFPQAIQNIWPALGNEFISLIKESSIVSVIGVKDLIYQSRLVQADTYRGVMPLVITMILYFIITFSLSRSMKYFERKMGHSND